MIEEYPIYRRAINANSRKIKGFLTETKLEKNQVIIIGEDDFLVSRSYLIKIKYFPNSNRINVYRGHDSINSPTQIDKFIKDLGLRNKADFMQSFFKNPSLVDGVAVIWLYYNQFTDFDPFY